MTEKKQKPSPGSYTIQDIKLIQGPLKIRQIRELLKMVSGLEISTDKKSMDEINVQDMIDLILGEKLQQVAELIFGEPAKKVKWDDVTFEQLEVIVQDFLQLNPSLIKRLSELFGASALMKMRA